MLFTLIRRWFGRSGVQAPPTQSAPQRTRAPASARQTPAPGAIGARRPLVDARGEVVGYAFHLARPTLDRLLARGDATAVRAHLNALFASARLCEQLGCFAYAELPVGWLRLQVPADSSCLQVCLLDLPPGGSEAAPDDAIAAWRAAGVRLGWREGELSATVPLARPDFVVRDAAHMPAGAAWVAPDLADIEAMEAALRAGAAWAGSDVRLGTEPREVRALPPQAVHLMQLLHRLVRDEDAAAVVAEIKADAALSVRLLQYLNSPGLSRGHTLDSIEQAVAVLGRDALYHWASGLLVRMAPARPAAGGLQALALSRARLAEALAAADHEPSPGALYLLGLASVLPLLMQTSLAEALRTLHLPDDAKAALLLRQGPWAKYLDVIDAIEASDASALDRAAAPLGGTAAVLAISAQTWIPR